MHRNECTQQQVGVSGGTAMCPSTYMSVAISFTKFSSMNSLSALYVIGLFALAAPQLCEHFLYELSVRAQPLSRDT